MVEKITGNLFARINKLYAHRTCDEQMNKVYNNTY